MIDSFDDFHAHAAVVIRAFPESGLVVIAVDGPVFAKAPEPFAVFPVYQIGLYEIPACQDLQSSSRGQVPFQILRSFRFSYRSS